MVAPLIVGSSRVVAGERKGKRVRERVGRTRQQLQAEENAVTQRGRKSQTQTSASDLSPQKTHSFGKNNPSQKTQTKIKKSGERTKALYTSIIIIATLVWFWLFQFGLALVSIVSASFEEIPIAGLFVAGKTFFMAFHSFSLLLGIAMMVYAAFMYTVRGVKCFSGLKGVIFILCIAGYIFPFLNLFPWFAIWMIAVIFMQGDPSKSQS